jgi:hypothetical protein
VNLCGFGSPLALELVIVTPIHGRRVWKGSVAVMMFVITPALAAQSAAEAAGGAATGSMLAGAAPAMGAMLPMGGEEVSAMLASAIAAHAAQFLAVGALGVAQREAFAATVATSAGTYTAMNALGSALLAL